MKKTYLAGLAIVVGVAVGGVVTYSVTAKKSRSLDAAYLQEDIFKEVAKCNRAYFESSPGVAILMNEQLIEHIESLRAPKEYEYLNGINLFVASARLGKLYRDNHDENKSEEHFRAAIKFYNDMAGGVSGGSSISNKVDVLNELQMFDAKLKQYTNDY